MRIVSERTDEEIAEARALAVLDDALKDLTANLLRVVRGAGKPYDVRKQVALVHAAYAGLAEANPRATWPDISEGLSVASAFEDEMTTARECMVRGALQIAASKIADQPMQERAGRDELMTGFRAIEEIRAENRRAVAEIERLERAKRRAAKAKLAAKKKPKPR